MSRITYKACSAPICAINQSVKFVFLIMLVLLSGCGSSPKVSLHPYVKEIQQVESMAIDAVQLNNYRASISLYDNAYQSYAAIDDVQSMTRIRVNQAQLALLIEELSLADRMIGSLSELLLRSADTDFDNRLVLLKTNLAIASTKWTLAKHLMSKVVIAQIKDTSLRESFLVAAEIIKVEHGLRPQFSNISTPLIMARQLRLKANLALRGSELDNNTAVVLISQAKDIYQQAAFTPGMAETLILQAKSTADPSLAGQLRKQAAIIFKKLGNTRALTRYKL